MADSDELIAPRSQHCYKHFAPHSQYTSAMIFAFFRT
jgi:hypothetical protein